MDPSKDYYRELEISRQATPADVKKAYRRLVRKYHPDVSKEPDAEARVKAINEAYEVLSNPERRREYDELRALGARFGAAGASGGSRAGRGSRAGGFDWTGAQGATGAGFGGFGAHDFADILRQAGRRGFARGDDIEARLTITLEQALKGDEVVLQLPGRGAQKVRIPAGARPGGRLRLRGRGEPGLGEAPAGDLLLTIDIAPQDVFRIDGSDLIRQVPITPWEAALGGPIEVATPFGTLRVKVPPGSQSGKRLRVPGKGFPGKNPGDLYLELMIHVPSVEEAGDWYRKMAASSDFQPRDRLKDADDGKVAG